MDTQLIQSPFSTRHVLKDLREIMSKEMDLQKRLNKIVTIVAEQLNVQVCSLYILRPGEMLELYATYGLDTKSVHETFLRVGEGLIGEIALQRKALTFENAWEHPSFVYKPETKEKAFKSLLGVPIIRGDNLLGVFAVQTTQVQEFSDEMVELMETISMVLAEMLASIKLEAKENPVTMESRSKVDGVKLIAGVAVGQAVLHQRLERVTNILAKSAVSESKKLNSALKTVAEEIKKMLENPDISPDQLDILNTYLLFTQDKGWTGKINQTIETGLTAEAAVQKVSDEVTDRMAQMQDDYIKERIHDLKDLANRLIRHLKGKTAAMKTAKLPKNTILVAHSMGPAELLDYDTQKIKAIVLEEGSQTMHVVIVARSLNIPVLGGIKNIFSLINTDDELAVDATKGHLFINPSDEVLDDFDHKLKTQKRLDVQYQKLKKLPGVTTDGVPVSLRVNAGLSTDLLLPEETYFDGVGLYRTELPFMTSEQLPDVQMQTDIYKRAILQASGKPIVFRTLDIGSDKVLPYFENRGEQNPAMGWRSIRITLDRRALLRGQLRAFIRASEGKELHIMFPMIASLHEFIEAKKTLQIELERERQKGGVLPSSVKVGTMLEVPSLIFQLPELVKLVDFISIGTNDLSQFLFATDRGNPIIWDRYDSLSPAMLKVLKYINDTCQNAGVPCSVCGEMAGKPLEAM
ncbi:MAG: phosphoenolpyruvate--protein phosphotransferase, partial [Alphaproteobacteria bacterium]